MRLTPARAATCGSSGWSASQMLSIGALPASCLWASRCDSRPQRSSSAALRRSPARRAASIASRCSRTWPSQSSER